MTQANTNDRKVLVFAVIAIVLLCVGLLARVLWKEQGSLVSGECQNFASASLTPAAGHFVTQMEAKTLETMTGIPIEGFEPSMFLHAFPGLLESDFNCVQAMQGVYTFENGEVVFKLSGDPQMQSSAAASVTSYGMGTLLENLGRRLSLPITTEAEVDAIIRAIEPVKPSADYTPQRASLEGRYICLPHVNTEGPQTLECAFGIQTPDGSYYAIDFALMSQLPPSNIKTGDYIRGNGVLVPIENLSTDHWRKYPIKGIFSITDSLKIN